MDLIPSCTQALIESFLQYRASRHKEDITNTEDYLTYGSCLSDGLVDFNTKRIALLGLTAMIQVLAQMKNLRRGPDTQGTLKKINIDQIYEGYANFMAPGRMGKIRSAVEEKADSQAPKGFRWGYLETSDRDVPYRRVG